MSVILQIVFNPEPWFQLFGAALGRELGGSFGTAFGNFLGETLRLGVGLLGGNGGNGGNADLFGAFLR